jgi:hypothetical protein
VNRVAEARDPLRVWRLKRRVGTALLMPAYAAILQFSYSTLISPVFDYLGMTYRAPALSATFLSVLATVVISLALPTRVERTSDFVLWCSFLIAVAPSILIAQYADILSRPKALSMSLWIAGIFLLMVWAAKKVLPVFTLHVRLPPALVALIAVGFSISFYGYLVLNAGASFEVVALDAVQDVRTGYKTLVATAPLMGYALQLQTAVLNPIFMAIGVVRRRLVPLLVGVVGQVLIYSVTGYKLTILSPVFVIALAYYLSRRDRLSGFALVAAITGSMELSLALDGLSGGRMFVTIFINRLMAGPGVLTSAFFEVFDGQEKYHWAHSFLRPFFDSPYQLTPGYYVGRAFQGVDSQANVNLFGDGYANLGMLGVAIEAAFLLLILVFLDASARGLPIAITVPSSMVAALGLTNNSSFTSVLTGGIGGLIVAFAIWPRPQPVDVTAPAGSAAPEQSPEPSQPGSAPDPTRSASASPAAR